MISIGVTLPRDTSESAKKEKYDRELAAEELTAVPDSEIDCSGIARPARAIRHA